MGSILSQVRYSVNTSIVEWYQILKLKSDEQYNRYPRLSCVNITCREVVAFYTIYCAYLLTTLLAEINGDYKMLVVIDQNTMEY